MGTEYLVWAVQQDVPSTHAYAVLAALASYAGNDKGGFCYPSQETIAKTTKQTVRSVRNQITALIESGHIKRSIREGRSGYILITERNMVPVDRNDVPMEGNEVPLIDTEIPEPLSSQPEPLSSQPEYGSGPSEPVREPVKEPEERKPPTPFPKIGKPILEMYFTTIWRAYPGRGKNGATGEGWKGSKEAARRNLEEILNQRNEEKHEAFINCIVASCGEYEGHLDRSGSPGKTVANWLRDRGWEDSYASEPARPANTGQAKPYSHTVIAAAERAKEQLRTQGDQRFDAARALAAINGSGSGLGRVSQAPRLAIDDNRTPETPVDAQAYGP